MPSREAVFEAAVKEKDGSGAGGRRLKPDGGLNALLARYMLFRKETFLFGAQGRVPLPSNEACREIDPGRLLFFPCSRRSSIRMAKPQPLPDFIPMQEVARTLETTEISVLMHVKRRLLTAQEVDGAWQVTRESLEHFLRTGQDRQGLELCRISCAKKGGCSSCG